MAKGKATPAVEAPAVTGATAEGTTETAAPKKVKKERLFKPATDYTEIRKAESKLSAKFNRVGRQVKALGLSAEAESTILGLIESEFQIQVQGVVGGAAKAPAAPAAELV